MSKSVRFSENLRNVNGVSRRVTAKCKQCRNSLELSLTGSAIQSPSRKIRSRYPLSAFLEENSCGTLLGQAYSTMAASGRMQSGLHAAGSIYGMTSFFNDRLAIRGDLDSCRSSNPASAIPKPMRTKADVCLLISAGCHTKKRTFQSKHSSQCSAIQCRNQTRMQQACPLPYRDLAPHLSCVAAPKSDEDVCAPGSQRRRATSWRY